MTEQLPPPAVRPERLQVLYIAGMTRSGSTLLGLLLAANDGLWPVGEVWRVWDNGVVGEGFCSCRSTFEECPFWTGVRDRDPDIFTKEVGREMTRGALQIISAKAEAFYWLPAGKQRLQANLPDHFLDTLTRFYRAVSAQSGASQLIDFTKSPVFGDLVSDVVDFTVVHLVRDPRAVVHSLGRVRRYEWAPGQERELRRYGTSRATAIWLLRNRSARRLTRRHPGRSTLMRYEDLVSQPEAQLRDLGDQIGRELKAPVDLAEPEHHIMGGNPTFRFGGPGDKRIKADRGWLNQMPPRRRWLVDLLSIRERRRYQYNDHGQ